MAVPCWTAAPAKSSQVPPSADRAGSRLLDRGSRARARVASEGPCPSMSEARVPPRSAFAGGSGSPDA
eukprot:11497315-Alexandrium_andersonii.AAC.1